MLERQSQPPTNQPRKIDVSLLLLELNCNSTVTFYFNKIDNSLKINRNVLFNYVSPYGCAVFTEIVK